MKYWTCILSSWVAHRDYEPQQCVFNIFYKINRTLLSWNIHLKKIRPNCLVIIIWKSPLISRFALDKRWLLHFFKKYTFSIERFLRTPEVKVDSNRSSMFHCLHESQSLKEKGQTSCYIFKLQHHKNYKRPKADFLYIQKLDIKTHSRINVVYFICKYKIIKGWSFICWIYQCFLVFLWSLSKDS